MTRESTATIVARIEERLKNHIEENKTQNTHILSAISELCGRVNHEVASLETERKSNTLRIESLEKTKIAQESKYKGRMELFKWSTIGLTILLSILGILSYSGVI